MKIGIAGVPSSAGGRAAGVEKCPVALRDARLVQKLIASGNDVIDYGDIRKFEFVPDTNNPKAHNKSPVTNVCNLVARIVERILGENARPLILGGDCSIAMGSVAGIVNTIPRPGLMYLDADTDINTPETTPSGTFDGMVVSHIIGKGTEELSRMAKIYPMLKEENIVLFGFDPLSGFVDPPETEFLKCSQITQFPIEMIRKMGTETAAKQAFDILKKRADGIFVHFDVDFLNGNEMPAKDILHRDGLLFKDAETALRTFARGEGFIGMEITEFNPTKDTNHVAAKRLVDLLTSVLTP
jgi:arginase